MSDFMKWLYAHYIRPQLDAAPQEEYEMWLSLLRSDLTPDMEESYEKCREFTAIQAFSRACAPDGACPRSKTYCPIPSSARMASSLPRIWAFISPSSRWS